MQLLPYPIYTHELIAEIRYMLNVAIKTKIKSTKLVVFWLRRFAATQFKEIDEDGAICANYFFELRITSSFSFAPRISNARLYK